MLFSHLLIYYTFIHLLHLYCLGLFLYMSWFIIIYYFHCVMMTWYDYYDCFHYYFYQFSNPFFLFVFLFSFCFVFSFLLLIKQLLFSHETDHVSRLLCFFVCFALFLELKFYGDNSQPHWLSQVPKVLQLPFIYCCFNIILHFILSFTSFVVTRFDMNLF